MVYSKHILILYDGLDFCLEENWYANDYPEEESSESDMGESLNNQPIALRSQFYRFLRQRQ